MEWDHDKILINHLFITGHNELCYDVYKLMRIQLYKSCRTHFAELISGPAHLRLPGLRGCPLRTNSSCSPS